MAALTIPEALKMMEMGGSGRSLAMLKSVVTVDALFARIPMIPVSDIGILIPREGAEPTGGDFYGDQDTGPVEESVGSDDVVSVPLRRIVGDIRVDRLVEDFTSGAARDKQFLKKVKATARKVQDKIINGAHTTGHTLTGSAAMAAIAASPAVEYSPWLDSGRRGPGSIKYTHSGQLWQFRAPGDTDYGTAVAATTNGTYTLTSFNKSYYIRVTITTASAGANGEGVITFSTTSKEFDGLKKVVVPSQVIDPTGGDGDLFTLAMLDGMITNLKVGENPAFVMSGTYIDLYYALLRALGGAAPEAIMLPGYGRAVPAYRGIPILRNDNIATNETVGANSTASLYLASFDAEEGLALAVANLGQSFDPMSDPSRGPVLGWRVTDLGDREGADQVATRVAWNGALVLKSPLAAVRRRGVRAAIA